MDTTYIADALLMLFATLIITMILVKRFTYKTARCARRVVPIRKRTKK